MQRRIHVRALLRNPVGYVFPEIVAAVGVPEIAMDDHIHAGIERVGNALGRHAVSGGQLAELVGFVRNRGHFVDIE